MTSVEKVPDNRAVTQMIAFDQIARRLTSPVMRRDPYGPYIHSPCTHMMALPSSVLDTLSPSLEGSPTLLTPTIGAVCTHTFPPPP